MQDMSILFEINRTLGTVNEKLDNIEKTLDFEGKARKEMGAQLTSLELRTVFLERDMNAAKPFVDKAKQWEQRGIGMIATVTAVGAIFGGILVGLRTTILAKLGLA